MAPPAMINAPPTTVGIVGNDRKAMKYRRRF
jgi:hypothetical protein